VCKNKTIQEGLERGAVRWYLLVSPRLLFFEPRFHARKSTVLLRSDTKLVTAWSWISILALMVRFLGGEADLVLVVDFFLPSCSFFRPSLISLVKMEGCFFLLFCAPVLLLSPPTSPSPEENEGKI